MKRFLKIFYTEFKVKCLDNWLFDIQHKIFITSFIYNYYKQYKMYNFLKNLNLKSLEYVYSTSTHDNYLIEDRYLISVGNSFFNKFKRFHDIKNNIENEFYDISWFDSEDDLMKKLEEAIDDIDISTCKNTDAQTFWNSVERKRKISGI